MPHNKKDCHSRVVLSGIYKTKIAAGVYPRENGGGDDKQRIEIDNILINIKWIAYWRC